MKDWIVDYGAPRHICGNISAFTPYTMVKEEEKQVFIGNSRSSPVIGKGKFLLKKISGNVLTLNDVLHVLDIRWNLVSVSLLGKTGVKIMFESDKIMLTKVDAFVRKGYCNQGLFMLDVLRNLEYKAVTPHPPPKRMKGRHTGLRLLNLIF